MKGLSLTSEDELQNLHSVLFDISFICLSILSTFVYARHGLSCAWEVREVIRCSGAQVKDSYYHVCGCWVLTLGSLQELEHGLNHGAISPAQESEVP